MISLDLTALHHSDWIAIVGIFGVLVLQFKSYSQPLIVFSAIPLAIIILLTIFGNILVLIALCIDFALRSPTHLLMGNLACADLLLGN